MSGGQTEFTEALLDPGRATPAGLTDPEGRPAGKRFAVYRNNVAVSLTEALELAFPVVRKLVGEEFFAAMAGVFLRAHPPATPLLMFYGDGMAEFLAGFAPVQHLAYLPDIARLELALRESYHAADAAALSPQALVSIPPDRLMQTRLRLAPALRLVRSAHPVVGIWEANTRDGAPKPQMRAEDALITRPGFDPEVTLLPPGAGAFVAALVAGRPLADAVEAGEAEYQEFDLTGALGLLIQGQAIVGTEA